MKRCRSCGRNVNPQDWMSQAELCEPCYDEAGLENSHQDGEHEGQPHEDCPMCLDTTMSFEYRHLSMMYTALLASRREAEERIHAYVGRATYDPKVVMDAKYDFQLSVYEHELACWNHIVEQLLPLMTKAGRTKIGSDDIFVLTER